LRLFRVPLVGLFNLLLLQQQANQRVQKLHILLPKSNFYHSTISKAPPPCFHRLLNDQLGGNYPLPPVMKRKKTFRWLLFPSSASVPPDAISLRTHPTRAHGHDWWLGFLRRHRCLRLDDGRLPTRDRGCSTKAASPPEILWPPRRLHLHSRPRLHLHSAAASPPEIPAATEATPTRRPHLCPTTTGSLRAPGR